MLSSLWAVAAKEWRHVLRDPATRFVFLIPLLQLTIFGYAIRVDIEDIPSAVVDLDGSEESRQLVALVANSRAFHVVERQASRRDLEAALVAGRVKVGLLVPDGFGRAVRRGERAEAQVLVDGSYSSEASTAVQTARNLGLFLSAGVDTRVLDLRDLPRAPAGAAGAQIDLRPRLLFNPQLRSANFFVPGLVGVILQLVTMMLTAFAVVRERESGTLEQMLVTPVGPLSLLLGKLAPYAVIGALQTVVVLLLMVYLFGVPVAGSLALLAGLSLLFLLTSLSLGLIVSTLAHNQAEAMQFSMMVLLPSILLSGFVFPIESMPAPIRPITYLIPVRYFIEVLRGVILRGADIAALWRQAAALGAYTVVLLGVSALRVRRGLS